MGGFDPKGPVRFRYPTWRNKTSNSNKRDLDCIGSDSLAASRAKVLEIVSPPGPGLHSPEWGIIPQAAGTYGETVLISAGPTFL